jgi:hypothetical protein
MRGLDLQPLAAGVSALLLVAAMGWWMLSTPELVDPGQPTWKGSDIVRLKAAVPEIAPFETFYVNHDNPFVPHQQRMVERDRYNPERRRAMVQTPPRPAPIPPPKAPVAVIEPPKPQLVLPKLSQPAANAPVVYGMVVSNGQEMVIVRMSGSNDAVNLKPGDRLAGWTLVSIDSGNLTTFLDPQGLEQRFAIGQGNLAVAHDAEETGKGVTGGKGEGQGAPKPPPGTPANRPPVPMGADGPIPRPPPREERRRRERPPESAPATPGTNQPQAAPPKR